jgi:hypothetical protein
MGSYSLKFIVMKKELCMKKILFVLFILAGCAEYRLTNDFLLERYNESEVPVCVAHPRYVKMVAPNQSVVDMCDTEHSLATGYKNTDRLCVKKVVPYSYCLSQLPKPVHLVEKRVGDMTICYDRNNKIELPILYCQKDMVNIQTTDVTTNVIQQTKVSNKTVFN